MHFKIRFLKKGELSETIIFKGSLVIRYMKTYFKEMVAINSLKYFILLLKVFKYYKKLETYLSSSCIMKIN